MDNDNIISQDIIDDNDVRKLIKRIVVSSIKEEVPDAVEDTLSRPDGTYFTSTVMIAKTLSDVDKTTKAIREDTKFISKLLKKIEKKNDDLTFESRSNRSILSGLFTAGGAGGVLLAGLKNPLVRVALAGIVASAGLSILGSYNKLYNKGSQYGPDVAKAAGETSSITRGIFTTGFGVVGGLLGGSSGAILGAGAGAYVSDQAAEKLGDLRIEQKLRAKANSGTFEDRLTYLNYIRNVLIPEAQESINANPDATWQNWALKSNIDTKLKTAETLAYGSASRTKDDSILPSTKPLLGEYNLRTVWDNIFNPRQAESLNPTSNEEPISGSDMSAAMSPNKILVANISDRNHPDNGQLVRVVSKQTYSIYLIRKLTGESKGSQLTIDGSKLTNFREISIEALSLEISMYEKSNAHIEDKLSGGSSTNSTMRGSRGADNLGGSDGSFDISGNLSPFQRIIGGSANNPMGSYGGGSGYHSAGGSGPGRSYGSGGGGGGAGTYPEPPPTKEMVYDPLSGKLIDPGRSTSGSLESDFFSGIMNAEGTNAEAARKYGFNSPYDIPLGYGKYGTPPKPLSEMTILEAYQWAETMRKNPNNPHNSSAIGAFQIIGSNIKAKGSYFGGELSDFMKQAGLGWNDKFDEVNQKKLAYQIAARQGLGAWEGFKRNPNQRNLAQKGFASLNPNDIGPGVDFTGNVMKDRTVRYDPSKEKSATPFTREADGSFRDHLIQRQNELAKVRDDPLNNDVADKIAWVAYNNGVYAEVYSGGQDSHGPDRIGSTRHDHGMAGDSKFFVYDENGNKRYLDANNKEDKAIFQSIIRDSARVGLTGVGMAPGYMGTQSVHLGMGGPWPASKDLRGNVWGAGGSITGAPKWVLDSYRSGLNSPFDLAAFVEETKNLKTNSIASMSTSDLINSTVQMTNNGKETPVAPPAKPVMPPQESRTKDDEITELTTRLSDLEKKIAEQTKTATETPSKESKAAVHEIKEQETSVDLPTKIKGHTYNEYRDPRLEQFAYA